MEPQLTQLGHDIWPTRVSPLTRNSNPYFLLTVLTHGHDLKFNPCDVYCLQEWQFDGPQQQKWTVVIPTEAENKAQSYL